MLTCDNCKIEFEISQRLPLSDVLCSVDCAEQMLDKFAEEIRAREQIVYSEHQPDTSL